MQTIEPARPPPLGAALDLRVAEIRGQMIAAQLSLEKFATATSEAFVQQTKGLEMTLSAIVKAAELKGQPAALAAAAAALAEREFVRTQCRIALDDVREGRIEFGIEHLERLLVALASIKEITGD